MIYRNAPSSGSKDPNAVLVRIKIQGLKNFTFWIKWLISDKTIELA